MCINNKQNKGDEEMAKTATVCYPDNVKFREHKISNALKEVEMIESGKLAKKSARDFLKESRNQ